MFGAVAPPPKVRRQVIHLSKDVLQEIQETAVRLDRSISWVVQQAWKVAHAHPVRISVVVPAYNEARNIPNVLKALLAQRLDEAELIEIVVVASGCTDATAEKANEVAARDPRVRVIVQDARMGKASALNAYFRERNKDAEVVVICAADIIPQPGCLALLAGEFKNPTVGMAGARPMPVNPRGTLVGNMINLLWDLHHERACQKPKLGEMVAVRANLIAPMDERTAVDEASLEADATRKGFSLRYTPGAVVANRGPTTLGEYFKLRRRINSGHYWLRKTTGYTVSTFEITPVLRLAMRHITFSNLQTDASYAFTILLEGVARAVGYFDVKRSFSHAVWTRIDSAHEAIAPEPPSPEPAPAARAEPAEKQAPPALRAVPSPR
jgi:poly-beta-1,6-N-acetyl-D-glucosamine synthase